MCVTYDDRGRLSQKRLFDGRRLNDDYYREGEQKGRLRAITRGGFLGTPLVGEIDGNKSDGENGLTFGKVVA